MLSSLLLAAGFAFAQDKEFKRYDGGRKEAMALEGKPAIALAGQAWFNTGGKKLDWKALRGKVVVLDFWAQW